jgi:hypothetical protein
MPLPAGMVTFTHTFLFKLVFAIVKQVCELIKLSAVAADKFLTAIFPDFKLPISLHVLGAVSVNVGAEPLALLAVSVP